LFKGLYQTIGPDKIRVTELPVGFWTQDFKEHLESLQEPLDKDGKKVTSVIKDYDDMSKDTSVDFTVTFQKGKLIELEHVKGEYGCNGVEKILKLYSTNSTTNMNLFNASDRLRKYNSVSEIIDDYYETRLEYYDKRKMYLINALEHKLLVLSNKSRYIQEVLDDSIDLRKKKKPEITELLIKKQYNIINGDNEFNYLIKMPMDSVSEENVAKLLKEHKDVSAELDIIRSTTIQQMWTKELLELEHVYNEYTYERKKILSGETSTKKKLLKVVKKKELVLV
jgi:DNA topoisomerase-2